MKLQINNKRAYNTDSLSTYTYNNNIICICTYFIYYINIALKGKIITSNEQNYFFHNLLIRLLQNYQSYDNHN